MPEIGELVVARPRLESRIAGLLSTRRVVFVIATAGAGKTTAVAAAVRASGRRVAWLTLDRTDQAPGRLLVYLEASLRAALPTLEPMVSDALAAGLPQPEVAALLVESVTEDVVLVIDELERLDDSAASWAVVEALMRYAPPQLRLVMTSRVRPPSEHCQLLPPAEMGMVSDTELAFTEDEAAEALSRSGGAPEVAADAVAATGGWVTGVLFDTFREGAPTEQARGDSDPLDGYLSAQILGALPDAEREFLVSTSILDRVSLTRAERLGLADAAERMDHLREVRLPARWEEHGTVLICHPRFREHLRGRLEQRGPAAVATTTRAYARLLIAEGRDEEAAEELLRIGATAEAVAPIERAVVEVVERLDLPVARRWLAAARLHRPRASDTLTLAELMTEFATNDYRACVALGDELDADGLRDAFVREHRTALLQLSIAYGHMLRERDAVDLIAAAPPSEARDASEFTIQVSGPMHVPARQLLVPPPTGSPADAIAAIGRYFTSAEPMVAAGLLPAWLRRPMLPWQIGTLRAAGRVQEALGLLDGGPEGSDIALHAWLGPDVLVEAGLRDRAMDTLESGLTAALRLGSLVMAGFNRAVYAKALLRLDGDPEAARAVLASSDARVAVDAWHSIREAVLLWDAAAALRLGADAEAAGLLRTITQTMRESDRLVDLPIAATYLAEAEWRLGDDDAADRAADLALAAADRYGSRHGMLLACMDLPAVVSRRLDAEAGDGSPWRDVARALRGQEAPPAATDAPVEFCEFGSAAILRDGEKQPVRIYRSYELLGVLQSRENGTATRTELLEELFDGRSDDSARAYLRQAIRGLRSSLPEGLIDADPQRVVLSRDAVDAESARFERGLAEAARLSGDGRLQAFRSALALYERGDYLPEARSRWAADRREALTARAVDGRHQAARAAFELGHLQDARTLVEAALELDELNEPTWQLAMRIAAALDDERTVLDDYRRCVQALARIGVEPSAETRRLLDVLRR